MGETEEKYPEKSKQPENVVDKLLSKLSLEEKIAQLIQIDMGPYHVDWIQNRKVGSFLNVTTEEADIIRELNLQGNDIPILQAIDAIHGHCFHDGATVFPTPLAMSCSWNPDFIRQVGEVTAKEMRVTGFHWTFAPNLDLARDPRWGRVNETFGEDSLLASEMGAAMIQGFQDNAGYPVIACPKHFAAYGESTGGRDSAESEVSERKLRSLFLPPFKKAVEVGAKSIMTAYQAIDGVPCTINKLLLHDILKNEWEFDGVVITDWDNISRLHSEQYVMDNVYEASIAAFKSGNHIMMATPSFYDHMLRAVSEERVDIETINNHVRRLLRLKLELGLFDWYEKEKNYREQESELIGHPDHVDLARRVCEESIVMLKNDGVLPLKDTTAKIAVIGPNANNRVSQLGDWAIRNNFGKQDHEMGDDHKDVYISILDGIRSKYPETIYHKGCTINSDEEYIDDAVDLASSCDYIIAVVGDNLGLNGEIKDRANLDLTGRQLDLLEGLRKIGKPLIVVLVNGKPLILNWIDEHADAILETFNPGLKGGEAVANVISGNVNPSGKLSISFPRHVGQLPVYYNQIPGWHGNSDGRGKYIDCPSNPLYQFGYGLSYSNFIYDNLEIKPVIQQLGQPITVTVIVTNTSNIDGKEVVQVYFNDIYSSVTTPWKKLIAFSKVEIPANSQIEVEFILESNQFSLINHQNQEVVEPGSFAIMVGGSSLDEELLVAEFEYKKV